MSQIPLGWVPDGKGGYCKPRKGQPLPTPAPVDRESPLHNKIIEWCNNQFPKVKYIRARSDRRSTIAAGAQDFTLFLPAGRTLCVECKAAGGKLDQDQLIWKKEMEMLGHFVFVVWNLEDFLRLINNQNKDNTP